MNSSPHRLPMLADMIRRLAVFALCIAVVRAADAPPALPAALHYRSATPRAKAMAYFRMKPKSEACVVKGLEWLRDHQNADGSWGDSNKPAMTGLALLCFLGHGETPDSKPFGPNVAKAAGWILDNGAKSAGRLNMEERMTQVGVYEHGICTLALGEYYTMTRDERAVELFKQAITHIVLGQGPGGGWTYNFDKSANDFDVSGWQIQALRVAQMSGLAIPAVDAAMKKAFEFAGRIRGPEGGYGYRGPEDRYSLTGVGLLTEIWATRSRFDLIKGMDWMLAETEKSRPVKYKGENADLYAWYYHTLASLWYGGGAWQKWNRWFQDEIADAQNPDGSWPAPGGKMHGPANAETATGKVYRTTLCILMLESFYRLVPAVPQ